MRFIACLAIFLSLWACRSREAEKTGSSLPARQTAGEMASLAAVRPDPSSPGMSFDKMSQSVQRSDLTAFLINSSSQPASSAITGSSSPQTVGGQPASEKERYASEAAGKILTMMDRYAASRPAGEIDSASMSQVIGQLNAVSEKLNALYAAEGENWRALKPEVDRSLFELENMLRRPK